MKILVVDDSVIGRKIISQSLIQLGHTVETAGGGVDALQRLQAAPFDLVVSDWMMPGMPGTDLVREIRKRNATPYTYFIIITALDREGHVIEALDAGADDFINKPVNLDELAARVRVAGRMRALVDEVNKLEGLLSICAYCKKIRQEDKWVQIEQYVSERSDAEFSHGICPACFEKHYPE